MCNSNYYGLIFNCPVENELNSCVYSKIRVLPLKERITYYNALTEDEKKILIEKHQCCLAVREKKSLFHKSQ
jgi:hypothetical protein